VALVRSATLPEESREVTSLAALAAQPLAAAAGPVVMAVGEVFADRAGKARGEPPVRVAGRSFMDMALRRAAPA
jgi:siroheme synthase